MSLHLVCFLQGVGSGLYHKPGSQAGWSGQPSSFALVPPFSALTRQTDTAPDWAALGLPLATLQLFVKLVKLLVSVLEYLLSLAELFTCFLTDRRRIRSASVAVLLHSEKRTFMQTRRKYARMMYLFGNVIMF